MFVVIALAVLLVPAVAGADGPGDLSISKSCRSFLEGKMFEEPMQLVVGHFFYAENPAAKRATCGWNAGSAWRAYLACAREVEKHAIEADCLPMIRAGVIVAKTYAEAREHAGGWEAGAKLDPLRCGQEPGNRYFWLEHGYCDLPHHRPDRAHGVVIWNHGIAGTLVQYSAPPALAMRLLQTRGWDVIALKRNNLGETGDSYQRAERRVLEEIAAQRARGYRKVVVAGQSFGGRVALEIGRASDDVFAALAFAPGMEVDVGNRRDQGPTDRRIREARVERLVVVYPGNDTLFGSMDRGRTSRLILAWRTRPWLLFDESAGLQGHGGGSGGNFVFRYGLCLARFLGAAELPGGKFDCQGDSDSFDVTRELLPPIPPGVVPIENPGLRGVFYGVVGETIRAVMRVQPVRGSAPAVLYRTANTSGASGAVYPVTSDGEGYAFTLGNKSTVAIQPRPDGTTSMVWKSAGEAPSNFSILSPGAVNKLEGILQRAPADF